MAQIPDKNKTWSQPNDGESKGNVFATWGIDFENNRGAVKVSNPLKNVFDEADDSDLANPVAKFLEYGNKLWAISNELFKTSTTAGADITDTSNWSQDATASSPDPGATVTDAVVFDSLLLVQDNDDIIAYNGSTWASWWKGTRSQSALTTGQKFILRVGPDGNLYITDGAAKVFKVTPTGTVSKTGGGTLDFSATPHLLNCDTGTSSRIYFGTEDTSGENAVIIEWDMGPQSISPNRIHNMGVKRVLCMATWNDMPIAILSDGSIKYQSAPGSNFVDWEGAKLPETKNQYQDDIIHKNGWAIIDNLPHFLINPVVDIDATTLIESTSNNWFYPAGIYCLDPKIGLYCRYPLTDGTNNQFNIRAVGALYSRNHKNTKFFASYDFNPTTSTVRSVIACEDTNNSIDTEGWLIPIPFESYDEIVKKLNILHKRLDTGDSLKVYYRRNEEESIRIDGVWYNTTQINTTSSVTGLEEGWVGFVRLGAQSGFFSTVESVSGGTTSSITFKDASSASLNDTSVVEFVNFKHFGTVTNQGVELSEFTIPQPKKSSKTWVWIRLIQAAGNSMQVNHLISE